MRVFVIGGAGYVGSALVPKLLADLHEVAVYDTFWFGDHLPQGVRRFQADIRDTERLVEALRYGPDVVIHLACISNDPSFELDKSLSREVNFDAFEPLMRACRDAGVRRFINASTSSVYGISDAPDVTEDHPHVPLTLYNTYKSQCEPIAMAYRRDDFEVVTVRPSTVCGYAPRQRLDLAVNILTNHAYHVGEITVLGGEQKRPNIHIGDMVDCYRMLIHAPSDKVDGETFNVGAGNMSIGDLAMLVQGVVGELTGRPIGIKTEKSVDTRSYQVNSDKIANVLGFRPRRTIRDAVRQLCWAFDTGRIIKPLERDEYYNVRQMRKVFPDLYRGAPPSSMDATAGVLSEIDLKRMEPGT